MMEGKKRERSTTTLLVSPYSELRSKYRIQKDKELGRGSFGVVRLAERISDRTLVAVKVTSLFAHSPA